MELPVARINYQRDKWQKDLARQRKQEEKRLRKLNKEPGEDEATGTPGEAPAEEVPGTEASPEI
jgi:hypothetical protein